MTTATLIALLPGSWMRASFEMLICASDVWSIYALKETNMLELINIAGVALEERAGSERA